MRKRWTVILIRVAIFLGLVGGAWLAGLVTPLRQGERSLHIYVDFLVVAVAVLLSIVIPLPGASSATSHGSAGRQPPGT